MGTFVQTTGFQKRTLPEIKSSLQSGFQTLLGPTTDISEEGPTGQIIGLLAKALADEWDGAQEVYNSYDPSMATGAALDRVCALTGIYRIAAAASLVKGLLYTDNSNLGVVIPSGRQARRVRGAVVFSLSSAVTISPSSCQDLYIKLDHVPLAGDTISITTSFGTFSTVIPMGTNLSTMLTQAYTDLAAQINATAWGSPGNNLIGGEAQVCSVGARLYPPASDYEGIQVQDLCLRILHQTKSFALTASVGWSLLQVGTEGSFACSVTGPYDVLPGELTAIVTSETGWVGVYNLQAGVTGRNVETDEELRLRRATSFGLGLATDTAIQNALYNRVPGIVSATVVSNRNLETDAAGRPGKCFEATVQGGADQDVWDAIWYAMPAGILAYGFVPGNPHDSNGALLSDQIVSFTRPTPEQIFVQIVYSLYSEEAFPSDGEDVMRAAILTWASTEYVVGKDVFAGRILGVIYDAVSGVGSTTVKVSTTGLAGSWVDYLDIDGRHYAYLTSANLSIAKAP